MDIFVCGWGAMNETAAHFIQMPRALLAYGRKDRVWKQATVNSGVGSEREPTILTATADRMRFLAPLY